MGMMNNIVRTKKCDCDKSNWVKYKTKDAYRRPDPSYLIRCKKCWAIWYSKAKYVNELPFDK